MPSILTKTLCAALLALPWPAWAQCAMDTDGLYGLFKRYREQVNTASRLEDLTAYFSSAFNGYYAAKMPYAPNGSRYLTQYWENLNSAKDIVIIYDYKARCMSADRAGLSLLAILNKPSAPPQPQVDLWNVTVHYVREGGQWLIDSFEYHKSESQRMFSESEIVDNFAVVR